MKIGRVKLDKVYFWVNENGTFVENFETEEQVLSRMSELRHANSHMQENNFYGDIARDGKILTYKVFSHVPVSGDVDAAYIESKNMTELKKRFKSEFGTNKNVRLATYKDGEIRSVSKKMSTKRILLVEEVPQGSLEEEMIFSTISDDGISNLYLEKYNLLPDARYIYHKEYFATDYESFTTFYNVRVYKILERAMSLAEMDEKVTKMQCDYTARQKYGIEDDRPLKIIKVPTLKEYPVFYREDKFYLDPHEILERFKARTSDVTLMKELIDDQYTNLRPKVNDEDTMESVVSKAKQEDMETKREKIARLKKILKGEVYRMENLTELAREKKEDYTLARERDLQSFRVNDALHPLLVTLIYRNTKTKEINYSILRHLAGILMRRDAKLNEISNQYMDGLVEYVMEQIEKGYFTEETKFHKL